MEIFWRFKFSSFLLPGLILEAREGGGLLSASLHCTDFQFLLGLLGQLGSTADEALLLKTLGLPRDELLSQSASDMKTTGIIA